MESAGIQVLRQLEVLFNSRNLDDYVQLLDPAVEWQVSDEDPDAALHRGPEAVRNYLEGWISAFSDLQIHTTVIAEDGDRVGTEIRFTGRGTESGAPLDQWVAFAFTVRAGLVAKVDDLGREGLQLNTK
jgi:ketosteroid isomerase-like protein